MTASYENALSVHAQALTLRAHRSGLLAANIANADTPNYLARDVNFQASLAAALGRQQGLSTTHRLHFSGARGAAAEPLYRVPTQPSVDGNTVDVEYEKAVFADNALRYQASLTLLGNRVKKLLSAIRGE